MLQKIKKLQRRACKLILGKDYTTLDAARKELHILSFDETVFLHKAKTMYKIANNAAPIYLTDFFQLRSNETNLNYSQLNLQWRQNLTSHPCALRVLMMCTTTERFLSYDVQPKFRMKCIKFEVLFPIFYRSALFTCVKIYTYVLL